MPLWKTRGSSSRNSSTEALVHSGNERGLSPLSAEFKTEDKVTQVRPRLSSKAHSFTINRKHSDSPVEPSEDYKTFRDRFLSSRNTYTGCVFGVSLMSSLKTASTEVMVQSESSGFGKVPVVVAKCGAYLKSKGLESPGIFRVTGNNRRVKELQHIFSLEPEYGVKFNDWDSYTVHDFASLLRRFLNNLDEPIIPLNKYHEFRAPLQSRPRILKHLSKEAKLHPHTETENQLSIEKVSLNPNTFVKETNTAENATKTPEEIELMLQKKDRQHKKRLTKDIRAAIKEYEKLFMELTAINRHLALYLLDLLSVFAAKSDVNLMSAQNLSAIFQPSILSHPDHDMDPKEYELSRIVIDFFIEYSYKLVPFMLKAEVSNVITSKEKVVPKQNETKDKSLEELSKENETKHSSLQEVPKVNDTNDTIMEEKSNIKKSTAAIVEEEPNIKKLTTAIAEEEPKTKDSTAAIVEELSEINEINNKIVEETHEDVLNDQNPNIPTTVVSAPSTAIQPKEVTIDPNSKPVKFSRSNINSHSLNVPRKGRPHSKSIGSSSIPQDMITSNKRKSRIFSWLSKSNVLSDTGELSATEEEGELSSEENDSPNGTPTSEDFPKGVAMTKQLSKAKSTNSVASSISQTFRPVSMFFGVSNKSNDNFELRMKPRLRTESSTSHLGQPLSDNVMSPTSIGTTSSSNTTASTSIGTAYKKSSSNNFAGSTDRINKSSERLVTSPSERMNKSSERLVSSPNERINKSSEIIVLSPTEKTTKSVEHSIPSPTERLSKSSERLASSPINSSMNKSMESVIRDVKKDYSDKSEKPAAKVDKRKSWFQRWTHPSK